MRRLGRVPGLAGVTGFELDIQSQASAVARLCTGTQIQVGAVVALTEGAMATFRPCLGSAESVR